MRCDDDGTLDVGLLPPGARWVVAKRDRDGWRLWPCETAEQARAVAKTALRAHRRAYPPVISAELAE